MIKNKNVKVSDEVKIALEKQKPVVALESTIISHGMPYPQNVETAQMLEETVRENGAIPATIAIINGKICIGLTEEKINFLATSKHINKASRRDFPHIIGLGLNAATTVAATMICASMVGIKFFATGGIGGVHRGAEKSFDISADLYELAETNCVVVSAGVKAILDLPLTMEKLETLGVPVIGYKTDELPAFYYRNSGIKLQCSVDSPEQVAKIVKAKHELNLKGGVLIGNPVPEIYEIKKDDIERNINQALEIAKINNVTGNKITPFLLSKMEEITKGNSLKTNIQLVKNNATVCSKIACEYSKL